MKIGVLSDTHIPVSAVKLPKAVYDSFKGCDLIIHAGDIVEMSVINELQKIAETKAVFGNMDSFDVKDTLPEKLFFKAEGKNIGVVHGTGAPENIIKTVKGFFSKKPDIIIFGHSHEAINVVIDGILFFNPGSPTDQFFSKYRSFGIIEIIKGNIVSKIVRID
ncbi:MAG: metallophosphoesterase family protein [Candidatus Omnitrophota bacterium]